MARVCSTRLSPSDVIDVDDVVNVVVLQDYLFGFDQGPLTFNFERIEGDSEIGVDGFVTIAERQPVEAQFDFAVALGEDFDI
jgi:hypothetical protein